MSFFIVCHQNDMSYLVFSQPIHLLILKKRHLFKRVLNDTVGISFFCSLLIFPNESFWHCHGDISPFCSWLCLFYIPFLGGLSNKTSYSDMRCFVSKDPWFCWVLIACRSVNCGMFNRQMRYITRPVWPYMIKALLFMPCTRVTV